MINDEASTQSDTAEVEGGSVDRRSADGRGLVIKNDIDLPRGSSIS